MEEYEGGTIHSHIVWVMNAITVIEKHIIFVRVSRQNRLAYEHCSAYLQQMYFFAKDRLSTKIHPLA